MTDVLIVAATDYRGWAAGGFAIGAVMVLTGLTVWIRNRRRRSDQRRACGHRLVACNRCGDDRCLACDPYDPMDDCDTRGGVR